MKTAIKRSYSGISQSSHGAAPAPDFIHHLKRSKLMNHSISIDDLPLAVWLYWLKSFVGFLVRKLFSKANVCPRVGVISSPILISLSALEDLISWKANEFLTRVSSGLSKPLTPLFKRLMSFHYLKEEPIVVGTYNDLVLCCASLNYQRDYYICNPYTRQWVALPPTPNCVKQNVAVGFICDTPYYEEDDSDKKEIIINANYRCRIVRLILVPGKTFSSEFSVEIFSSETGEWRKSIVSSPQAFVFIFSSHCEISYTYNRMLYWMGDCLDEDCENNLIGLDPFMMDDNNKQQYEFHFVHLDDQFLRKYDSVGPILECYGEHGGCLQMCDYVGGCVYVWDLKEGVEDETATANNKRYSLKDVRIYSVDEETFPVLDDDNEFGVLGFDPNNEEIDHVHKGN